MRYQILSIILIGLSLTHPILASGTDGSKPNTQQQQQPETGETSIPVNVDIQDASSSQSKQSPSSRWSALEYTLAKGIGLSSVAQRLGRHYLLTICEKLTGFPQSGTRLHDLDSILFVCFELVNDNINTMLKEKNVYDETILWATLLENYVIQNNGIEMILSHKYNDLSQLLNPSTNKDLDSRLYSTFNSRDLESGVDTRTLGMVYAYQSGTSGPCTAMNSTTFKIINEILSSFLKEEQISDFLKNMVSEGTIINTMKSHYLWMVCRQLSA